MLDKAIHLSKFLKEFRISRDLNQFNMAQLMCISIRYYYYLESKGRIVTNETARNLVTRLGEEHIIDYLLLIKQLPDKDCVNELYN